MAMLIHNLIEQITVTQISIVILLTVLALIYHYFSKKIKYRMVLTSSAIAILITIATISISTSSLGGTLYHIRLGWPLYFLTVSTSLGFIEWFGDSIYPIRDFDLLRFFVLFGFVNLYTLLVISGVSFIRNQVSSIRKLVASFLVLAPLLLTIAFGVINLQNNESNSEIPVNEVDDFSVITSGSGSFIDAQIKFTDEFDSIKGNSTVQITDATYEDGLIVLNVEHSGCAPHIFTLYIAKGWSRSLPPQAPAKVVLDSSSPCEMLSNSKIRFNAEDLFQTHDSELVVGSEVLLNIYDTSEKSTPLLIWKESSSEFTEEIALSTLLDEFPNLSYADGGLPPIQYHYSRRGADWNIVYYASGSGVPYIFSALCFRVTPDGTVTQLGSYENKPYDSFLMTDIRQLNSDTCETVYRES